MRGQPTDLSDHALQSAGEEGEAPAAPTAAEADYVAAMARRAGLRLDAEGLASLKDAWRHLAAMIGRMPPRGDRQDEISGLFRPFRSRRP